MQDRNPKQIRLVHADAIVSAGIAAILRSRDDMIVSTSGDQPCDLMIADHPAALEFIAFSKANRVDTHQRPKVLVVFRAARFRSDRQHVRVPRLYGNMDARNR